MTHVAIRGCCKLEASQANATPPGSYVGSIIARWTDQPILLASNLPMRRYWCIYTGWGLLSRDRSVNLCPLLISVQVEKWRWLCADD